jgi:xylulokinase
MAQRAVELLIGVDLGTSAIKTIVVDPDGRLLAVAAQEIDVESPHPGWAEQSPDGWLAGLANTVRQAVRTAAVSPGAIAAIGLSGQMHGTVCLNQQGQVLRPAVIWADQRSSRQVRQVYRKVDGERLRTWTGNPLDAGFMLATWLWLRENEPELAQETGHLLLPKDFLRYRLTGELGSEPSDASSTSLFDTAQRTWSQEILQALGVNPGLLPPLGDSAQIAGGLTAEMAAVTGLRAATPVVYGASDQACQALGNGVLDPGVVSCTIGTGGQIFAPAVTPAYDPQLRLHCFCHALPGRWHLMAAILAAGLSLRWLRDRILQGLTYDQLAGMAAQVPAGAEGLYFLPHLAGERTPHMDPQARASFVGLTLRHDRRYLARAIMEGVVFALRQGLELMENLGVPVERIIASGGAVRHPLWLQLQADIFNRPIYRSQTDEAAALGAALLAGIGVGIYRDVHDACQRTVRWSEQVTKPQPKQANRYRDAYQTYVQLYPALAAVRERSPESS